MPNRLLFIAFLVALVVGMTPINWVSQEAGTAYAQSPKRDVRGETVPMDERSFPTDWLEGALQGARLEVSPGFYVPDGSTEIDRPAFTIGGNLSFPLPVGDGHLRAIFGYNATPGVDIDNKNLTHVTGGPFMVSPSTDEFDVYRFNNSGTIHRTSTGLSFEYPMWCGWNPFIAMMFEWTHFGFDKENATITRTSPETAVDRNIRGASKDALGFLTEIGFLKDLPGDFLGRNIYAGCGITLRGTSTDFPRGDDQFRLEPGFNAHFAVDVYRKDRKIESRGLHPRSSKP